MTNMKVSIVQKIGRLRQKHRRQFPKAMMSQLATLTTVDPCTTNPNASGSSSTDVTQQYTIRTTGERIVLYTLSNKNGKAGRKAGMRMQQWDVRVWGQLGWYLFLRPASFFRRLMLFGQDCITYRKTACATNTSSRMLNSNEGART